jgi:hypothetical protein
LIDQKLVDRASNLIDIGEAVLKTARVDTDPRARASRSSGISWQTPVDTVQWSDWRARSLSFLELGIGSLGPYRQQFEDYTQAPKYGGVQNGIGVHKAAHKDLASGYLARFEERVRAALFADFLEMAEHLQANGFQDAAAVLGGGVLEPKLRHLCGKAGIQTTSGNKPKKAEMMNSELCSAGVYDLIESKQVTAWLGIRNEPAHGHYNMFSPQQIALYLTGIRDFITRHPS